MAQLHRTVGIALLLCGTGIMARGSFAAQPPSQVGLNDCQKTVKAEGGKFVRSEILAIATCLQKISFEKIRNNAAIDNTAARTCITQFRKLNDSRMAGKSLKEKLTAKIQKKCDPAFNPALPFTIDDITGKGSPMVPVPINTQQLDIWCKNFGGDGSIDTVPEWIDCIVAAHQCEVEQAIAEQYPRASEWLSAVKPIMQMIASPATDPNKTSDAVAGLNTVDTAIDPDNNGLPNITCPQAPPAPTCGTACCYMEYKITVGPTTFKPTSCFQYTGTTTEVSTFKTRCGATTASEAGFWTFTGADGACSAGPTNGVACVVGVGSNAMAIPTDSACP